MRYTRVGSLTAVAVMATATLAACGNSSTDSGSSGSASTPAAAATAATTTTTAAAAGDQLTPATVDYALKYTGGKAGAADASLAPVPIGLVYQEGGTPSFPEMGAAADATVKFINEQLGGIDGHPIRLVTCTMQSEEDGQKCGAEMISAKVPVADMGLAVVGNASLYKTINQKLPVLVASTSTPSDSTAPGVYNFSGGGLAVLYGMAVDTKSLGVKSVAPISVGNTGGKYTMEQIAIPALDKLGISHGKTVYYADDATTPDLTSALQAAGASKADAIFFDPSTPQQCVSVWDSMKQLGIEKPVIATPICNADAFVDHTGGKPDDWRIWGFGVNPRVTTDPESMVFNNVMAAYGASKYAFVGFTPQQMRDLLTIAKFGNELGADNLTPAAFKKAILAFRGPAFMNPGPLNCEKPIDPASPVICGTQAVGAKFTDGTWSTIPAVTNAMNSK